jgi:CYTH domain-containing protein
MAQEIERQFVINTEHPEWPILQSTLPKKRYIQSTIHRGEGNKLRVRLIEDIATGNKSAAFTFKVEKKSRKDGPNIRDEYEWEVPYRVALFIMIGHGEVIKTRYEYVHTDGKIWELDEYE